MQDRTTRKPALQPGVFCDICCAECFCACTPAASSQPADPPGWTRSAGPPNDEAVVLPVTMFNDRPFGPVFVPQ